MTTYINGIADFFAHFSYDGLRLAIISHVFSQVKGQNTEKISEEVFHLIYIKRHLSSL